MALARNRKKEPDAAAIAAFGAAADVREAEAKPPVTRDDEHRSTAGTDPAGSAAGGPKASLVRWAGAEDLRDELISYGKRNRYNMQEMMLETMRRGLEELRASES